VNQVSGIADIQTILILVQNGFSPHRQLAADNAMSLCFDCFALTSGNILKVDFPQNC
jgi:hypothetical protein